MDLDKGGETRKDTTHGSTSLVLGVAECKFRKLTQRFGQEPCIELGVFGLAPLTVTPGWPPFTLRDVDVRETID